MKSKPTDANGKRLRTGDRVRVLAIPDLSGMPRKRQAESNAVFRHLVGKEKRIAAIDRHGNAEIVFKILKGKSKGLHVVGIETNLLRRRGASGRIK